MGRSIMTCSSNGDVVYTHYDSEDWNMDSFYEYLDCEAEFLCSLFPSLENRLDWNKWKYNECRLIAGNELYNIYISTYYDLVAYSFVARAEEDGEWYLIGLANKAMEVAAAKLEKSLGTEVLVRVGTFSNGESVFRRV